MLQDIAHAYVMKSAGTTLPSYVGNLQCLKRKNGVFCKIFCAAIVQEVQV